MVDATLVPHLIGSNGKICTNRCRGEGCTDYFSKLGIIHHISRPHTHEQNVMVEHRHHHIVKPDLSHLAHSGVP